MAIELLTVDMFSDKVGDTFVIEEAETPPIELTLTDAHTLRNVTNAARLPFSLLFTTEGGTVLPQRIYTLRHVALGVQSIFLVPIGKDGDRTTYQAVFN